VTKHNIVDENNLSKAYLETYEQFASDGAFLWMLRSVAIKQPHYNAKDVAQLEQRIDAQLDGLLSSIEQGWQVCKQGLDVVGPGEVFTAMVFAMRSRDVKKIQFAVEVGLSDPLAVSGLISALGWLPEHVVEPWIKRFLNGKDLRHKFLGIAACSVRREDPGLILESIFQRPDCIENEALYGRALRLVGELRQQSCMPYLLVAMNSNVESIRFWASWSAGLLGNHACLEYLQPFVFCSSPFQERAISLAFRLLPIEVARQWISMMAKDSRLSRAVIKATGALGDPHAVNWLIDKMSVPTLTKLAGEAFYNITGIHIVENNLHTHVSSSNIELEFDDDENLATPSAQLVANVWRVRGAHFIVGRRYFLGELFHSQHLMGAISDGYQRQRYSAAVAMTLLENGPTLINVSGRTNVSEPPPII